MLSLQQGDGKKFSRGWTEGENADTNGRVTGVLKEVFGFVGLRAGQEEVVSVLMEGRGALAIFPTGGGK